MEINWGPPGAASRSFEASYTALRGGDDKNGPSVERGYDVALSPVGWWLLLLLIAVCRMATPDIPDEEHRRGREIRLAARRRRLQHWEQQEKRKREVSDPLVRQAVLQKSLEIQRVASVHGSVLTLAPCELEEDAVVSRGVRLVAPCVTIDENRHPALVSDKIETDDATNETLCAICLDQFTAGDFVAWSRRSSKPNSWEEPLCPHVFHRCVNGATDGVRLGSQGESYFKLTYSL
jgi:hypothetical protein